MTEGCLLPRFRPLSSELRIDGILGGGGLHDLERATLAAGSARDLLVFRHEMHHDIALTETNFGIIQSLFRMSYDLAKADETRSAICGWTTVLYNGSRQTHEVHATYLSVKEFPSSHIQREMDRLPEEYLNYYETLSAIIDPLFASTYVQFMVAKTMTEVCFSSRLIDEMALWTPRMVPELEDTDVPDNRLEMALPVWSARLHELKERISEESKVQPFFPSFKKGFDVLSESDWLGLTFDAAREIDDWLLIVCRDWLYAIISNVLPCSKHTEWFRQRKVFAAQLSTYLRMPIDTGEDGQDSYDEDERHRNDRRASREGRTVIANSLPADFTLRMAPADISHLPPPRQPS